MGFLQKLFFRIWYIRKPPWDTEQTPPELFEFIEANPAGRALDLGCGTGTNVITLAQNGWQVTGVDFVPKAIRSARKKVKQAGVKAEVLVGDVTRLNNVTGQFDLILDIGCYHSLDPSGMRSYQNQVRRLLASGGTYLLYLFFKPDHNSSAKGGSNATEGDLLPFDDFLNLLSRKDSTERGMFHSAWLTYRRNK